MKNKETALKVGLVYFNGCTLFGFNPNWTFRYPKFMSKSQTFTIPDFVVGLLAERAGLAWQWGEDYEDRHPIEQLMKYIENLEKRNKTLEELVDAYGTLEDRIRNDVYGRKEKETP